MKEGIRKNLLNKRLEHKNIKEDSEKIVKKLLSLPEIQNAQTILLYYPHKNEVNVLPLFEILSFKGKRVLFPKTVNEEIHPVAVNSLKDLKKGNFGILEPEGKKTEKEHIDIVIVPAVAFNKKGYRIGYGKGFYDRFLKDFKGLKVGVAYDFQIVDDLPVNEHDVPVDIIVTPTNLIKVNKEDDKND